MQVKSPPSWELNLSVDIPRVDAYDCNLKEVLESKAPNAYYAVPSLGKPENIPPVFRVMLPEISLHCSNEKCGNERLLRPLVSLPAMISGFLLSWVPYVCKNCEETTKFFALAFFITDETNGSGLVYKIGEWPPFGPLVSPRVQRLIQPARDMFLQGLRAEKQGMDIAASTYYRRVVEGQKNLIIEQIIHAARNMGMPEQSIKILEKAKNEQQFQKAIDMIKDYLPPSLLIRGQNPLALLHRATSRDIHSATDAECLGLAQSIRAVLTELADRVDEAAKEQAGLKNAISEIMRSQENRPPE